MRSALIIATLALVACRVPETVGSVLCGSNADCMPPATICGVDDRCVPGCPTLSCIGGAACTSATGECAGGIIGLSCARDVDCDPPDVVCRNATHTCAAGCDVTGECPAGLACDPTSGHCCDADDSTCHTVRLDAGGCQSDSDCAAPTTICARGACVPGCAMAGCTAPLECDATSGHCVTLDCERDTDCDPDSTCTQAGACVALAQRGHGDCAGGTKVGYDCATEKSAAAFASCTGAPGPSDCPYCIDDSCFAPGLCTGDDDCSRGMSCTQGLCIAQMPQCPSTQGLEDVVNGVYAAGKAVCVHAIVTSVRSGYDGAVEVRLGTSLYLYADVLPMYEAAGVMLPTVGDEVTVHGIVRWDAGHGDRELLPVDWVGP